MKNRLYITELEEVEGNEEKEIEICKKYSSIYQAYRDSKKAKNDGLNFYEIIWEKDVESIIALCRKNGIAEITVSGVFSNMLETLADFEKRGYNLNGLSSAKDRFNGRTIPALAIQIH